jgi:arylsulfatase A-like enzyme/tetratricopeptide (TPR) repeat protein
VTRRWAWPLSLGLACAPAPEAQRRPDVVVITLDTVRADRLGAWGYAGAATPTLDALAARGRRYARAWSPLPLTIPAHGALFSGRQPPHLNLRDNSADVLSDDVDTMAERFARAGYATVASVGAFVTTRTWGFSQGFDAFFDEIPSGGDNVWHGERPAEAVIADLEAWRAHRTSDAPLFAWVHLYDAHHPYVPPPDAAARAPGRPYDGELAHLDDAVARLLSGFDPHNTVVVVVGDHGESLGEHGELTHGLFTYASTQHVPWIVAGPGITPGVVDAPVGLVDVLPTLLADVGLPAADGVDGHAVRADADAVWPVYAESWQLASRFGIAPHRGVLAEGWQLIALPRPELYRLGVEPGLAVDEAAAHPDVVARLQVLLDGMGFAPPRNPSGAGPAAASTAMLGALGYVEGTVDLSQAAAFPDPKDRAALLAAAVGAERRQRDGDIAGAIALLEPAVVQWPDVFELRSRLALALERLGRGKEAQVHLDAALKLDPGNPQLRVTAGVALAREGRAQEALDVFLSVAEAQPWTPRVRALALYAMQALGRHADARTQAEAWWTTYADDAALAGVLGGLRIESGDPSGWPLLELGATATVPEPNVRWHLGVRAMGEGRLDEAVSLLEREVADHPASTGAWAVLARLCAQNKDWRRQAEAAERALTGAPADASLWHLLVLARFNLGDDAGARAALASGLAVDPLHPDLLLMDANLRAKAGDQAGGQRAFEAAERARALRQAR